MKRELEHKIIFKKIDLTLLTQCLRLVSIMQLIEGKEVEETTNILTNVLKTGIQRAMCYIRMHGKLLKRHNK